MSQFIDAFVGILKKTPLRFIYRLPGVGSAYHFILAFLAAAWYRFPSRTMIVIGVTGTKGKTTTCSLIAQILNAAGHKTGMVTTALIAIGKKEWVNDTKQTMLGRFQLQQLLARMASKGCTHAVIETSSEGILQYRHRFIDYRVAVFTNLSPEHIERHGSFERYREAKVRLFVRVARRDDGVGIYNLDDPQVGPFLEPKVKHKYGFFLKRKLILPNVAMCQVSDMTLSETKTRFRFGTESFEMPLIGEFNVYNAASALCVALSQGVLLSRARETLEKAKSVPGRFELVPHGREFIVVVDYAHEPKSLEEVYRAVRLFRPKHIIGVLGAQGGGRDEAKRPLMAQVAARYCDTIILTNEDPYEESPEKIMKDMGAGIPTFSKVFEIIDRRAAIEKAISLGKKGDAVVITGKGGEVWMCVAGGKKIPWNDRAIVEKVLQKMQRPPRSPKRPGRP